MIDLIQNNPFRVLGVYSNSSQKEIVANQGRMKAFLNVGKSLDFPLDLNGLIPSLLRTPESVSSANGKLSIANEKFLYGQFWFIKLSNLDHIAFNHLTSHNEDKALEIWAKKNDVSSLQNRFIYYLIKEDIRNALDIFCRLYEPIDAGAYSIANFNCMELIKAIVGEDANIKVIDAGNKVLYQLIGKYGFDNIYRYIPDSEFKIGLIGERVKTIVSKISDAINLAKAIKREDIIGRYNSGKSLMDSTKQDIQNLKRICTSDDVQYQMIADELGLVILQCSIDYFNGSEAQDVAHKVMQLQKYALSIVVGKMAKDRCQENVTILEKIIKELPPAIVFEEDRAIKQELQNFCQLPDRICHSITLLKNTKPYINRMKEKLGSRHSYYLQISTLIVGNALHNLVEEVNSYISVMNDQRVRASFLEPLPSSKFLLPVTLHSAWEAMELMNEFDLEYEFNSKHYQPQRRSLKELRDSIGRNTSYSNGYNPSSAQSSSNSSDNTNWGCIIVVASVFIIFCISQCS